MQNLNANPLDARAEAADYVAAKLEKGNLSRQVRAVLEALRQALCENNSDCVLERAWREAWTQQTPDMTESSRRKAFDRGRDRLRAVGSVDVADGLWRLVPDAG